MNVRRQTRDEVTDREDEGRSVVCVGCGQRVTSTDQRITVGERSEYGFANPHGYVYRVGCWATAPGCLLVGERTDEFTWFAGHAWRIAQCGNCRAHLGWHFAGPSDFYGLIVDRIQERDDD